MSFNDFTNVQIKKHPYLVFFLVVKKLIFFFLTSKYIDTVFSSCYYLVRLMSHCIYVILRRRDFQKLQPTSSVAARSSCPYWQRFRFRFYFLHLTYSIDVVVSLHFSQKFFNITCLALYFTSRFITLSFSVFLCNCRQCFYFWCSEYIL